MIFSSAMLYFLCLFVLLRASFAQDEVHSPRPESTAEVFPNDLIALDGGMRVVKADHGNFLVSDNDLFISKSLRIFGSYDGESLNVLLQAIQPGDVVFDIGANIGAFTVAFAKEVGLNQETVASIIQSNDGNLWVAGNRGLSKLDNNYKFTNYTVNDGLLSNDFNNNAVFKDEKGVLYFGNYAGINFFNPENIITNPHEPSVYLSDIKIFNKSVLINDEDSPLKKVLSETNQITLTHQLLILHSLCIDMATLIAVTNVFATPLNASQ